MRPAEPMAANRIAGQWPLDLKTATEFAIASGAGINPLDYDAGQMALLKRQEVIDALTELGRLAGAQGLTLDLLMVGGGVMVLDLSAREATHDIDAVVLFSTQWDTVRRIAAQLAATNGWPDDWLNEAAKGFMVGSTTPSLIFEAPGIRVYRPAYSQLLAMKLCAWRDDVDVSDAALLLSKLSGTREEVWESVRPHLQPGRELTAKYALDDLWEQTR